MFDNIILFNLTSLIFKIYYIPHSEKKYLNIIVLQVIKGKPYYDLYEINRS